MIRQLFLVGEDYGNSESQYHKDKYCLTGKSGETMAALAGVDFLRFMAMTQRMNVVDLPDDWSDRQMVANGVARIMRCIQPGQSVILLGHKVASAFRLDSMPMFEWQGWPYSVRVARAPHPSGRNRVLNDPAVRRDFADLLRTAVGR